MIIAGLGNPGPEYESTRHNVGFLAIDALAERYKAPRAEQRHRALVSSFSFKGERHLLVKPQTFMNLSGESISRVLAADLLPPENLFVIVDDVNLPLGRLRLRPSGSDGGHNGLKSIIAFLGPDFWRLRIGVGQPDRQGGRSGPGAPGGRIPDGPDPGSSNRGSLVTHVLGPMSAPERTILGHILEELPGLVTLLLLGRGSVAMGKFNGRNFAPTDPPPSPPGPGSS